MRQRSIKSREIICRQIDARNPFGFNLLRISPEFLIDQNNFLPFLVKYFIYSVVFTCSEARSQTYTLGSST